MKYHIICGLFIGLLGSSVEAQHYNIRTLDIPLDGNLEAVDMNEKLQIIGTQVSGDSICPFFFDSVTKDMVRLCDLGFSVVTDINNQGEVVGVSKALAESNEDMNKEGFGLNAIYWSKKSGVKLIDRLSPEDHFSVATGINDNGTIIGSSGQIKNFVYCDSDCEHSSYSFYSRVPKGFIYSAKRGVRAAFPGREEFSSALAINNKGDIVGAVCKRLDSVTGNCQDQSLVKKFRGKTKLHRLRRESPRDYRGNVVIYSGERTESLATNCAINSKGEVAFDRFKFNRFGKLGVSVTQNLAKYDRGDYGALTNLNTRGSVVGVENGSAWVYTPEHHDYLVSCLFPQNSNLLFGNTLPITHLFASRAAAITDDEQILLSGDVYQDNLPDRIFIMEPREKSERGARYGFCPKLSINRHSNCNDALVNASGSCTVDVKLSGHGESFSGYRIEVVGKDYTYDGSNFGECPDKSIVARVMPNDSDTIRLKFNFSPKVAHWVSFIDSTGALRSLEESIFYYQEPEYGSDNICDTLE